MKKGIYTFLGVFALFIMLSSCEDLLSDLGSVDFNGDDQSFEFSIDPTDQTGEVVLLDSILEYNIDSLLAANEVDANTLTAAKLIKAEVSVVVNGSEATDVDLSAFGSIKAFISLPDGSKLLEVASATEGDFDDFVILDVVDDDLLEYIEEDALKVKVVGELTKAIEEKIDVKLVIKFKFTGSLLS